MQKSENVATSSFILSNYMHLLNGNNESVEKIGTEDLMIPSFNEDILINLCNSAIDIFKQKNRTLLKIASPSIVIGDLHGNLHDLIRIVNSIIDIFSNNVLFLGDYVDRGQFQLETITLLLALRIEYPNNIFLIRGNHEFSSVNTYGGFKEEILDAGYSEALFDKFNEVFSWLPISAVINDRIFCVHGGLSPFFHKISQIETEFKLPIYDMDNNNQNQPHRKHRLSDISDVKTVSQDEKTTLINLQLAKTSNTPQHTHSKHRNSDAEEKKRIILNIRSSLESKSPPLPSKPFPLNGRSSTDSNSTNHQLRLRPPPLITKSPLPSLGPIPVPPSSCPVSSTFSDPSSEDESSPILPADSNPSIYTKQLITHNTSTPIMPVCSNPFIKIPMANANQVFQKVNSPCRPIPLISNSSSFAPNSTQQAMNFFECEDENNNKYLLTDIMWSDPTNSCELFLPSNRGSGCYFGFVVTNNFLKRNNMKMIVRGHQIIKNGVETTHEKKVITVYSSSSLKQGGFAACIIFSPDDTFKAFRFRPISIVTRNNAKFFAPTIKAAKIVESHTLTSFNFSPTKMHNMKIMRKGTKGSIPQTIETFNINVNVDNNDVIISTQ